MDKVVQIVNHKKSKVPFIIFIKVFFYKEK